jgi:hypothetical protein
MAFLFNALGLGGQVPAGQKIQAPQAASSSDPPLPTVPNPYDTPGHLFILHSSLTQLACDVRVFPPNMGWFHRDCELLTPAEAQDFDRFRESGRNVRGSRYLC